MNAQQNLYEIQMQRFEVFKAQNPADFDVIFEIDEKKLYADKFKLCTVSTIFNAMLSKQQVSRKPISVTKYSFENFKEFITFIYSGECTLNDSNKFEMVDIAHFYKVEIFKKACEEYLLKTEWNLENVYEMFEKVAYKYSMEDLKNSLLDYVSNNLLIFIQSAKFQNLGKLVINDIVKSNEHTVRQEKLFEMVYKWTENYAKKVPKSNKNGLKSLTFNEIIKKEFSAFLTFFKFHLMNKTFIQKFVVNKSFLLPDNKLSDILFDAENTFCVTDENGKIMKGILDCCEKEKISAVIQSQKNNVFQSSCFKTFMNVPTLRKKLKKEQSVEWYLVYQGYYRFEGGHRFSIKRQSFVLNEDILLAKMIAENGFILKNWKFV